MIKSIRIKKVELNILLILFIFDIICLFILFKVIKLKKLKNNIINKIKYNKEKKNVFLLIQSRMYYNKFVLIYGLILGLFVAVVLNFFFSKNYVTLLILILSLLFQLLSLYFMKKFIKTYEPQNNSFKELFDYFLKAKYIIYICFVIIDISLFFVYII